MGLIAPPPSPPVQVASRSMRRRGALSLTRCSACYLGPKPCWRAPRPARRHKRGDREGLHCCGGGTVGRAVRPQIHRVRRRGGLLRAGPCEPTDYWLQQIWGYLTPGLLISRRLGSSAGVGSGCVILANLQFTSPPAFSRDRLAAGSRAICALTGRGVKDCNITREQRTEKRARQRHAGETAIFFWFFGFLFFWFFGFLVWI